jgi:hypothetical protein
MQVGFYLLILRPLEGLQIYHAPKTCLNLRS